MRCNCLPLFLLNRIHIGACICRKFYFGFEGRRLLSFLHKRLWGRLYQRRGLSSVCSFHRGYSRLHNGCRSTLDLRLMHARWWGLLILLLRWRKLALSSQSWFDQFHLVLIRVELSSDLRQLVYPNLIAKGQTKVCLGRVEI